MASGCGEIEPGSEFYDYDDKYIHNTAKLFIPARIPEELAQRVRMEALTAYRALGCRGMARIDFLLMKRAEAWCSMKSTPFPVSPTSACTLS